MELPVNLFYIGLAIYAIGCIAVAIEAGRRGWDSINVFVLSLLISPLIAAILYAPYKKEPTISAPNLISSDAPEEDPALKNLIEHLEKKA